MPKEARNLWKAAGDHLDVEGNVLNPYLEDKRDLLLRDTVRESTPQEMSVDEMENFVDFLKGCFSMGYARGRRLRSLGHRWIMNSDD